MNKLSERKERAHIMSHQPPAPLIDALREVSRLPRDVDGLHEHPAFIALRDVCEELYPEPAERGNRHYQLSRVLDRLGLWRTSKPLDQDTLAAVAARLDGGFTATTAMRVHMVPLDVPDNIPALSFGPNEVRNFSPDELSACVAPLGPVARQFDMKRFAQFPWLICRENVVLRGTPRQRASLFWNLRLNRDFAAIDPHKKRFPLAVENALFCMLLAPWEDWNDHGDINWRSFQTPWVLTIDHDLFADPARVPSPDTLNWEPDIFEADGEMIELERPLSYDRSGDFPLAGTWISSERWNRVTAALASPLFQTPIIHFLLSALVGDGIDEFMSHLTALEASLGRYEDSGRERVMKARITALLADSAAADTYGRLFKLRSEFVHGRVMGEISGSDRNAARSLAREVANALVTRAAEVTDRTAFLEALAPSRSSRK